MSLLPTIFIEMGRRSSARESNSRGTKSTMYSLARNREAVVAVARVSVRYLILLATLHVYYPLRAAHLSARSPFPGITGERTESARNQSTDQEGGKERKKGRKEGEKMCSKRKFPIRFSSVFLTERKKGWRQTSFVLPGTERKNAG